MKRLAQRIQKLILLVFFCIFMIACSRVTQENFEKIKINMPMRDVIVILGEPTTSNSVNIFGISGTSAAWKNANSEIVIQFLDNKVILKNFNKIKGEALHETIFPKEEAILPK